jgi:hypothetical protein
MGGQAETMVGLTIGTEAGMLGAMFLLMPARIIA